MIQTNEPQIASYSVKIAVPCKPILIIKRDIITWENFFIKMCSSSNENTIRQFDMCRTVLKWANCCGAELVKVNNATGLDGNNYIEFLFSFFNIDTLNDFCKDFYEAINSVAQAH